MLCDKCGIPAMFVAVKDNLNLAFCSFHLLQIEDNLKADGFTVYLESDKPRAAIV